MSETRLKKSGNQWRRMRAIKKRLREVTQNLDFRKPFPEWLDAEAHCKLRDYVRGRVEKSEQGRLNRIMGGPAQTDALMSLILDR